MYAAKRNNRRGAGAAGILCCLLIVAGLAGCGDADGRKTTMNQYAEDGYMGFSTAHPGMPTSPNSNTYLNTTEVVEQALAHVPHIVKTRVTFRGATVVVRLRVDSSLNAYDMAALQTEARERLNAALPRYTVRVVVKQ